MVENVEAQRYCSLYVNDMHLIVMLIPYIERELEKKEKIITILENDLDLTTITHQETQKESISDFEIFYSNKFHIIVEAKKGTILPSVNQLTKYANT